MKVESMIVNINKRLKDVYSIFGKYSEEYEETVKAVTDYIPSKFIRRDGDVYRISRTKSTLAEMAEMGDLADEMLGDVRQVFKGHGSIAKMAQRYTKNVKNAKDLKHPRLRRETKEQALRRKLGKIVAGEDELDYELWNEVDWDDDLYARGVNLWHTRMGTHGADADAKYNEIIEELTSMLKRQMERDAGTAVEDGGESVPLSDFL